MDNFYLKYAEDIPYPLPSVEIIKENYMNIWKRNILNELIILKNVFINKYSIYLNDKITTLINNIISLIEKYRYLFLEQYLYYLNNNDKFYININDKKNIFKIKFLKESYNKILLLIDNLCSCNKTLSLIYQDKLMNYEIKKDCPSKNLKVLINNEEIYNKINFDINIIEKEFENNKNIFNFQNNQDLLYPNNEEFNKLYEEFNANNYKNNLLIKNKINKNPSPVIKDKLLSQKIDIVIQQNNPDFDELLNLSKKIQEIKNDVKDIKEKQNNYCSSSMIEKNYFKVDFNNLKSNTIKLNDDINLLKDDIKEYNNKYIQLMDNIDDFHNKYNNIKNRNDKLNNKIKIFLNQYK